MECFRSTVADVIEYKTEGHILQMVNEIIEMKQKTPQAEVEMNVNFYLHCNVGEGHSLQSKEQIKNFLKDTSCISSIEEQETLNLKNAYSYLMSNSGASNHGLLEESMLRKANEIILKNIPRNNTKPGVYCINPRVTQFGGKFIIIVNPKICMKLFACSWTDSIHCLYKQRKVVIW